MGRHVIKSDGVCVQTKVYIVEFSRIYYQTTCKDPTLNGSAVPLALEEVHMTAMMVLLIAEN
jgi:hypothetical protein